MEGHFDKGLEIQFNRNLMRLNQWQQSKSVPKKYHQVGVRCHENLLSKANRGLFCMCAVSLLPIEWDSSIIL